MAIVTSEQFLVTQLRKMLGTFREKVAVMTMKKALIEIGDFDVFIVDEADQCLLDKGSTIDYAAMKALGFWSMSEKRTILMSATISFDFADALKDLFSECQESYLIFDRLIMGGQDEICQGPTLTMKFRKMTRTTGRSWRRG